jgi:hypothetical protein
MKCVGIEEDDLTLEKITFLSRDFDCYIFHISLESIYGKIGKEQ